MEPRSADTDSRVFFYATYQLREGVRVYDRIIIEQPDVLVIVTMKNVAKTQVVAAGISEILLRPNQNQSIASATQTRLIHLGVLHQGKRNRLGHGGARI